MKVKHKHGPVVQGDDYYPFGLTFNSFSRESSVANRWKFQGQEHIDALGLGWDSFKWRNHQPDLGRFFNLDPLAADYVHNSTYAFSENKVTNHVELEGLESHPAQDALEMEIAEEINKVKGAIDLGIEKFNNGVENTIDFFAELLTFTDDIPREKSRQQQGAGLEISSENGAGPDNQYAPDPDPNGKKMMTDESTIGAMTSITRPLKPQTPGNIGERIESAAQGIEAGAGAIQAAQNSEPISMQIVTDNGRDSAIWVSDVLRTIPYPNFSQYEVRTTAGDTIVVQEPSKERKGE